MLIFLQGVYLLLTISEKLPLSACFISFVLWGEQRMLFYSKWYKCFSTSEQSLGCRSAVDPKILLSIIDSLRRPVSNVLPEDEHSRSANYAVFDQTSEHEWLDSVH